MHLLRVGDVVELRTPIKQHTFYVRICEITKDEVRYMYDLMDLVVS